MSEPVRFIVDFARLDGWFHLQMGPWDVPRGPLGVLAYLPFVPLFWLTPPRAARGFLITTSLLVWYATLGPAFVVFLLALLTFYYGATHALARAAGGGSASYGVLGAAVVILHAPYLWLLFDPMPGFLPSLGESVVNRTNYLHWCGLAYIHLKAVLVGVDRLQGRLDRTPPADYLAYMLFAPTFKMGPLYRYDVFVGQIADARHNVQVRQGFARIGTGLLRLGIMLFVINRQISPAFFDRPDTLPYYRLVISCALVPLQLYFWIAGYCDIVIGIGRLMGFRVPEHFRGPWFVNNIADFWKRWSITLGQWLFDYPFRAMVANGFPRWLCFVLTFLYCGLWHGVMWSYVLWGTLQGFGLAVHYSWHRWWLRRKKRGGRLLERGRALGIVDGRGGWVLSWLLLVSYQLLTISIASDLAYAGGRFLRALAGLR